MAARARDQPVGTEIQRAVQPKFNLHFTLSLLPIRLNCDTIQILCYALLPHAERRLRLVPTRRERRTLDMQAHEHTLST